VYIEGARVQECATVVAFFVEVRRAGELGACLSRWWSRRWRPRRGWYEWGRCVRYGRKRERRVSY